MKLILTVDCPQLYVCTVFVCLYNDRLHGVGYDIYKTSDCGLSSVVSLYCVSLLLLHRVGCDVKYLTVDCPQLYVCTVYVYNDRLHRVGCVMKHLTVDCPQLFVCTVCVYNDRLHRVGCDVKHLTVDCPQLYV